MKTIVVVANMFPGDMVKDYDYLKENLDMKKYNLISPIMFMVKDNKYDIKDFSLKLIASAISLGSMYNEFKTIESIVKPNKTTIYFGPAHLNVPYEKVYCINKVVVDTQEAFIDDFLKKNQITFNYTHSAKSSQDFKTMQEFVEFINAL
jgi:hypothetical protein